MRIRAALQARDSIGVMVVRVERRVKRLLGWVMCVYLSLFRHSGDKCPQPFAHLLSRPRV